jgi:DNA-directed RNA polymerase subunit M/transcription elongation factor TFIIS
MSAASTGMICPSCGEMTYFTEMTLFFKDGKAVCRKCGYEFKSDKEGLEQQVVLYIKQFNHLNAVMFYNKATAAGLAESSKEVERIAQANGLPIPKKKCFIATAAYGTGYTDEVTLLQLFRDNVLLKHSGGRLFVKIYYKLSPPVADVIAGSGFLKHLTRKYFLAPVVKVVKRFQ